jgi:hypothetical protein
LESSGEFHEFDFLELVLTDHAADVLAVGAGLAAEAWRVGAERYGQLSFFKDLVAVEVGNRNLGRGDKPVVVILIDAGLVGAFVVTVKEILGKLRG